MKAPDDYQDIRDGVRALCAEFPDQYFRKIDEALGRIEDGSYGYCLETGEQIGIKRLEARPVATLSIEAQERRERREKQYGDRDDRYR